MKLKELSNSDINECILRLEKTKENYEPVFCLDIEELYLDYAVDISALEYAIKILEKELHSRG